MRKILFTLVFCCVFMACQTVQAGKTGSAPPAKSSSYDLRAVVAAVVELHRNANLNWPKHLESDNPVKTGSEFDVMRYFAVLRHLAPPEGQVLDYVYHFSGGNGEPHLYLRKKGESPIRTFEEFKRILQDHPDAIAAEKKVAGRLRIDGTPESYLELVVFSILAGQFYLAWHAGYNDIQIVTSREDVEKIVRDVDAGKFGARFSAEQKRSAEAFDAAPAYGTAKDGRATVSVVLFSKWRGFYRYSVRIPRAAPHDFIEPQTEELVKYNCGIMF